MTVCFDIDSSIVQTTTEFSSQSLTCRFVMMYSNSESRFSGLAGDNFTQWSTALCTNIEASQISDLGALKVLH
jgi:hypothetical protein